MQKMIFGLAAATLLSACGSEPSETEAPAEQTESAVPASDAMTADPAAEATQVASSEGVRPRSAAQCVACHTFEKDGPDRVGPNLWGIHGQPAGKKDGFAYSTAMLESGFIWDDATLDAYLENTRQALPGGKMSFGGVRNSDDRAELIAYLASLTDAPAE